MIKKTLGWLLALALPFLSFAVRADVSINAGGAATGTYSSDRYYSGGSAYTWGGQSGVYNTERWSSSSFSYAIPVSAGQVKITLLFRETCASSCPYTRIFNVTAEGHPLLSNFQVAANAYSEQVFTVTTDSTLNLQFTKVNGEAWVNAIKVEQISASTPSAQTTVTLTASPTSVISGNSSTLTWSSSNATSCTASGGWSGTLATSGSQSTGALTASTSYTLTCAGTGGSAAQTAAVTVTTPTPTVTFAANPTSVSSGGNSTLTWSSTNATSCTASGGWGGTLATNGSQTTGALTATTSYTLACTGAGGSTSQTATVSVASAVPTVTLTANPSSVSSGNTSTLTWSSTNATNCSASGGWSGRKSTSGSYTTGTLTATSNTTYKLTCTGSGGSASHTATVTVLPVPTVTLSAAPTSVTNGSASTLTWNSTNATSCTASGGWNGSKSTSGSQSTGALSASTSYTLVCSGSGGSTSQTTSVTVTAVAPPAVTLTASPSNVASGSTSTLAWSSTNATSCTASGGWSGTRTLSGSSETSSLLATTTFVLTCAGAGGSASSSTTVNVSGSSSASLFPLHVESGKRYLIDAQGNPFLITGDTPWSLIVQLTDAQIDQYLDDRKAKGFNTILVNLIEHQFATNAPKDIYGNAPFLTAGNFSTPNETYFARAAGIIQKAADRGLLVMLTPAYMGYSGGNEGWYQEMVSSSNGSTKLRDYGQYLANRFSAYNNILWVNGGDYDPPNRTVLDAIANGIRDINTTWLQTFHGGRFTSALDFVNSSETWLTVNTVYADAGSVPTYANQQYAKSTMPFFLIEGTYEGTVDEATTRLQAYQAVLSGATGQMMGNDPIWYFGSGWQTALNSGASSSMQYLRSLLEARAWSTMVPNSTTGKAALAADASFELVYLEDGAGSISVNLTKLSGPNVTARWYDPTSGAYTTVTGSPFANTTTRTFTRSTGNSHGDTDWVLVLESTP